MATKSPKPAEPDAVTPAEPDTVTPAEPDVVPVRLLLDCEYGACNTLAHVPREAAERLRGVVLDDHPNQVAAVQGTAE